MANELELFQTLIRWLEQGVPCALATVVQVRGSAPRHAGARLLVQSGGSTVGTIGGGALERAVIEQAQSVLKDGEARMLSYNLKPDLGMACGGGADVYVEPLLGPERLFIFGGGHVGQALAPVAAAAGFAVTVIDERPEFACAQRFPAAELSHSYEPADWGELKLDGRSYCVVATHGHGTDFKVVRGLMALDPPPRYVGMIGSKTKRSTVERQLADDGVSPARIAALHTPMGLAIGAETPAEIAVSIAAELVQVRRQKDQIKE